MHKKRRGWSGVVVEELEARQLLSGQVLASAVESTATQVQAAVALRPTYRLYTAAGALSPLASTGPQGYSPSELRTAYGINQVTFGAVTGDGSGQTIAIIDAYNDPNIAADLHAFDVAYGLADPTLKVVGQDGSSTLPTVDPSGPGTSNWALEIALDVEWAHAIAPGASLLLVEAKDASPSNLFAAANWARSAAGVSVISMSFGGSETSSETGYDAIFTTPSGHQGVTFIAASGDAGAPAGYPAYSPNVVAVGGTSLAVDALGNYQSETGWSGSGGGLSTVEGQPSYQSGVVTQSASLRANPDVSFDAAPATGVSVYDSYDLGASTPWLTIGGTSLASPSWAGIIAIADQGRVIAGSGTLDGRTQTLPLLYSAPAADFHDVTSGNNGFAAGSGYDLVTGRGSPRVNFLAPFLVTGTVPPPPPPPQGPTITSITPSAVTVTAGTALTLTANGVSDTGGTGLVVTFYQENNGVAGLQTDPTTGDFAFTPVTDGSNAITLDTTGALGAYTFYAQLTDSSGGASAAGTSAPTTSVTVTAPNAGGPAIGAVVANPNPVVTGNAVTLSVTGVTDAFSVIRRVYYYEESNGVAGLQTGPGGDFAFRATTSASGFSIQLDTTGVTGAVTFYARATDFLGNASATGVGAATVNVNITSNSPPNTPTGLTATAVSATEIDLAFAEVDSGQTGYSIERSQDPSFASFTRVFSINRPNALTYSDTGLNAGTLYYYRVQAFNDAGSSGFSNTAQATTQAATVASTPVPYLLVRDPSGIGPTVYQFQVKVVDTAAVNVATLSTAGLVHVTGPNGFSADATFVSLDVAGNGLVRTATYQLAIAGGWSAADEGKFTVSLVANVITDVNGQSAAGGTLGEFYFSANPLFSERYYLTTYQDVARAVAAGTIASGYQHFLAWGNAEGRNPSAYFDEGFYLAKNADVRAAVASGAFASGFDHFMKYGAAEGRQPSLLFDQGYYLAMYPDVAAAIGAGAYTSALEHFMVAGQYEGRNPSIYFDTNYYLGHNADVAAAIGNGGIIAAFAHFLEFGLAEGRNPIDAYDNTYYLAHNPDVAAAVASGVFASGYAHYVTNGQYEPLRRPAANFDPEYYLATNPDVAAAVAAGTVPSAFYHYLRWGRAEGRRGVA